MSSFSFLPDCGILSSPSLSGSFKNNRWKSNSKLTTPLITLNSSEAKLGSGASVSFYKSPKAVSASPRTAASPRPSPQSFSSRKRMGGVNKGVGHGIKKPKTKAKDKRASNPAKVSVRRLKQVKPPPRIAGHRSPALPGGIKKKHQLSSPGLSLLESPESGSDFMPAETNGGKVFFTSRARAAATVQITKTVKLSADYGGVTLKNASSIGLKKNVGKSLINSNNSKLSKSDPSHPSQYQDPSSFENRPKPTRFTDDKSPLKIKTPVRSSPRKRSLLRYTESSLLLSPLLSSPLKHANINSVSPLKRVNNNNVRSPLKRVNHNNVSSPLKRTNSSPSKSMKSPISSSTERLNLPVTPKSRQTSNSSPLKLTPRRMVLTRSTPDKHNLNNSETVVVSNKKSSTRCDVIGMVHYSPKSTPTKVCSPRVRSSPRLNKSLRSGLEEESPKPKNASKLFCSPLKENSSNSQNSDDSKYFDVFNPIKWKDLEPKHEKKLSFSSNGLLLPVNNSDQRIIDAGQKEFGAKQCQTCGLLYDKADPDDVKLHEEHHNRIMSALTYKSFKKERQISQIDSKGGCCVMLDSSDPVYVWKKLELILSIVNEELGFTGDVNSVSDSSLCRVVILYVIENKVAGCLVAEKIDCAYRIVPQEDKENGGGVLCCSNIKTKVLFGINRIWVRNDCRRLGIASTLVDSFRRNMVHYHFLKLDEFAFSDPTPSGHDFARNYTKREDFLVYRNT